MTGFIVCAVLLALVAAACVAWPLLRARADGAPALRVTAIAAVLLVVAGAAAMYPAISTWSWKRDAAAAAPAANLPSLAPLVRATEEKPDDVRAWLELGGGYLHAEQFELSRRAFERANRLANGRNALALSGMAQTLVAAEDPAQNEVALSLFNRALAIDAHQPQALFFTAIALMNSGQAAEARARFATMLELDLPTDVRAGIQQQIDSIDADIAASHNSAGTAIHLQVSLAPALAAKVPAGATLFVFVRAPQGGPPLAVKRLAATFPQVVELSAADSPMPANRMTPGQHVQIVARISASGGPVAGSGDLYGELSATAGASAQLELVIAKQNP